jgi:hypothetical protein
LKEEIMRLSRFRPALLIAFALAAAAVGPLIFPIAEAGHSTLSSLAVDALLPAVAVLIVVAGLARLWHQQIFKAIVFGALAGALATIGLEVVREIGFHLGAMPGDMPRLMGVLLLDRFALGPSTGSDVAGWAYHFWNGTSFGVIYALIFGTARRWIAILYALAIGVGFLVSPVVISMGVGYFGAQFSIGFPVTVLLAHLAFGLLLGILAKRFIATELSPLAAGLREAYSRAGVEHTAFGHPVSQHRV